MHIGILQTGHAPDEVVQKLGDYDALFRKLLHGKGLTFTTWNVVDMDFPQGAQDADGWLITGSKHGAYEDHAFIDPLENLIREIYRANRPLVGICFGHQIIAQALGGKVEKFKDGWSVGHRKYDWNGEKIALNAWHQDQVTERPADAVACAENDFCANAALLYGDRAFTVQAHPEFDNEVIQILVDTRGEGVVPTPLLDQARTDLTAANDNAVLAARIARFFQERSIA